MIRTTFDREVMRIENELMSLGHQVRVAILRSVKALEKREFAISREIIKGEVAVRQRKIDLEMDCLKLIATQQPMASDLRTLAAMITVASELERIYDYAKGIGKINLIIGADPLMKPIIDLKTMTEKAEEMLLNALTAFSRKDIESARAIPNQDDIVDELYNQIFNDMLAIIVEDKSWFEQVNYLMWAAHNIERTADRVINICERIIFMVTGELTPLGDDEPHDINLDISSIR